MGMVRNLGLLGAVSGALWLSGCDKAEETAKKVGEEVKKDVAVAEKMGEEGLKKAKELFEQTTGKSLEEVEKQLKDLSEEKMADAKVVFDEAKQKFKEAMDAAPGKFEQLKKEFEEKMKELKAKFQ